MSSKASIWNPFFFIFDFYIMTGSNDDNDVLLDAILYFYPTDETIKHQKLLDCGEIVGIVQYFQRDLFRSIPKTFYFQKTLVAHEYYGRHSGFLCVPIDRYTQEEAHIYLKHILDSFNMLYGTWNHVHSIYGKDNKMNEFLSKALTPIVNYVLNQKRSIVYLFPTIEYTSLKPGNQRVLLESKHCLDYFKSKYELQDGLIAYDNKILYSTWDSNTTVYMQLLLQLRKELPKDLVYIPWESEFKLKKGVSLFRIFIRQPSNLTTIQKPKETNIPGTSDITIQKTTILKTTTPPINIFDDLSSASDDSSSFNNRFSSLSLSSSFNNRFSALSRSSSLKDRFSVLSRSSSITDNKRAGVIILTDQSGSSEETGFETDTMDESSISSPDVMSKSSASIDEIPNEIITTDSEDDSNLPSSSTWHDESISDDQKLELRSRSSTMSNDMEKTVKIDCINSVNETLDRIHFTQIESIDKEDDDFDDYDKDFRVTRRLSTDSFRNRGTTITSNVNLNNSEFHKSDRHELRINWKDIPDKNNEHERNQLVLYIQRNSRMMFAGIFEQSLLTDDYLKKLWSLIVSQMAALEPEIQVIPIATEIIKYNTDVKFNFNENTRSAEFDRIPDGTRYYRKIPSEESSYMALFTRLKLNQNSERKAIGLSRGNHLVSIDRRLPDRITYSCRGFQETLQ